MKGEKGWGRREGEKMAAAGGSAGRARWRGARPKQRAHLRERGRGWRAVWGERPVSSKCEVIKSEGGSMRGRKK